MHLDLYSELVAPDLKVPLFAETWRHTASNLPSNCSMEYWVILDDYCCSSFFSAPFSWVDFFTPCAEMHFSEHICASVVKLARDAEINDAYNIPNAVSVIEY